MTIIILRITTITDNNNEIMIVTMLMGAIPKMLKVVRFNNIAIMLHPGSASYVTEENHNIRDYNKNQIFLFLNVFICFNIMTYDEFYHMNLIERLIFVYVNVK